ncbi:MAG TPA: hypothetical protein VIN65_07890 [Candidatus Dormibacteraeota bacterium]
MENAVIVSAARTPVGTMGGAFVDVPAATLGAVAAQEAMRRAGLEAVDEVLMGIGGGQGIAMVVERV